MKKILYILYFIVLIFCLSACSNSDLELEKLKVERENSKVNDIALNYKTNLLSVTTFNDLLIEYLQEDTIKDNIDFEQYSNYDRVFKDTIDTILENINKDFEKIDNPENYNLVVNIYPILIEDSGNIKDYIRITKGQSVSEIYMIWQGGKFINYYFE